MRQLPLLLLMLTMLAACGPGDPPSPKFNLDGFQSSDAMNDRAAEEDILADLSGDAPGDTLSDLPADLLADLPEDLSEDLPEDMATDLPTDLGGGDLPYDLGTDDDVTPDCAADQDCDDEDPCTDDVCTEGVCASLPKSCDDENPCTIDSCAAETGECLHEATEIPCDDGDACTTGDLCVAGVCAGIDLLACDDGNPCTDDSCDSLSGCQFVPNEEPCDDGEACTTVDQCLDGACVGLENVCLCADSGDCQPLQDNDLCNGSLACIDGLCQIDPASVVTCTDDDLDDCVEFSCDTASGTCKAIGLADGTPCDDHDACTLEESCNLGLCTPASLVSCDDGEVCTTDTCAPDAGCVYTPNSAPCDDGNLCTEGDVCSGGICLGPDEIVCDDGITCTSDDCAPATGCVHEPLSGTSCDDDEPCTVGDVCQAGICLAGEDVCAACGGLKDGDPCTDNNPLTLADMCVEGACSGWSRTEYEPRPTTEAASLADVTFSSGQFFAAGHDTAASSDGQEDVYTWVVTLDQGDVALYHEGSERTDTIYVAVGNDMAMGGNGRATYYDGAWAPANELEDLLQEGVVIQEVRNLWGGRFQDMSATAPQIDRWWVLGRNVADTLGLTRLCTREASADGGMSWGCEVMNIDTYGEYEYPSAMDALLKPAGDGWQLDKAFLLGDAISQFGDTTTPWLNAFTATDMSEWSFFDFLPDAPPLVQDWRDVVAKNAGEAWAVGTQGLIARIKGPNLENISLSDPPSLALTDWTSIFMINDLLVLIGEQTEDVFNDQGILRTRTFVILTHRGKKTNSGWNMHVLGSVTTACASWQPCDAIKDENHLSESAYHEGEAYVVGRGWGPSILPDGDQSVKALIYHLDVPTL